MITAPIRVKICGMTTPEALDAAAGADWVGFVFVPASPRAVTPTQAASLSRQGPPGPGRVGLFMNPTDADIESVLSVMELAAIQLYAPPARADELRARFGVPVWRALGVGTRADLPTEPADAYLLDAPPPPGSAIPGGNAHPFDWTMLKGWAAPAPWLLAGGLTPENVASAITMSGATSVDVSSGVEHQRGKKDPTLVRAFIAAARGAVRPPAASPSRSCPA